MSDTISPQEQRDNWQKEATENEERANFYQAKHVETENQLQKEIMDRSKALTENATLRTEIAAKQAEVDQARTTRREFQRLAMGKHKKDAEEIASLNAELIVRRAEIARLTKERDDAVNALTEQFEKDTTEMVRGNEINAALRARLEAMRGAPETKVGVMAIIQDQDGRILLGLKKRAFDDAFVGKWVTPGGRVKFMEPLESAIVREVREETGLTVEIVRALPSQEILHNKGHYVFFSYLVRPISGEPKAGDDISQVRWFSNEELNDIDVTPITRAALRPQPADGARDAARRITRQGAVSGASSAGEEL